MLNTLTPTENRYYQFRPWLIYQDNKEYFQVLNADHIIAEATPADELLVHYYKIVNNIDDDNLEEKIDKLKEILNEFMSDSDSGNLIKFPGKGNLH
jgi:hypothetical protein